MTRSLLFLTAVLALVVAACSPSEGVDTRAPVEDPSTTLPAPPGPTGDGDPGRLTGYGLEAGTTSSYEVTLNQHLEMTVDGTTIDPKEFPGDAVVDIGGSARFSQSVAEGPEDDTYEVTVTGDFLDLTVTGEIDGDEISDLSDAPSFGSVEPVNITFVVDERGNLIVDDDESGGILDSPLLDPSSLGAGALPGVSGGQFLGPALPEEGVDVGDTWTYETETPGFGEEPIVTTSSSNVTGREMIDGREVLVIETSSSTPRIEVDLGDFLVGMFGAIGGNGGADDLGDLVGQIKFLIIIDGASSDTRSWVDPTDGTVVRAEVESTTNFVMDMSLPNDDTGELEEAMVNMAMDQNMTYVLTEAVRSDA